MLKLALRTESAVDQAPVKALPDIIIDGSKCPAALQNNSCVDSARPGALQDTGTQDDFARRRETSSAHANVSRKSGRLRCRHPRILKLRVTERHRDTSAFKPQADGQNGLGGTREAKTIRCGGRGWPLHALGQALGGASPARRTRILQFWVTIFKRRHKCRLLFLNICFHMFSSRNDVPSRFRQL